MGWSSGLTTQAQRQPPETGLARKQRKQIIQKHKTESGAAVRCSAWLGLLVFNANLTKSHLKDIASRNQTACIYEMLEALSIKNV
jgi:hypothetical protein